MEENNNKKVILFESDSNEDEYYDSEPIENFEELNDEEYNQILIECAFTIQNNFFDYIKSEGVSICENLNINKLITFIEKVN